MIHHGSFPLLAALLAALLLGCPTGAEPDDDDSAADDDDAGDDDAGDDDTDAPTSLRGMRYCEILLVYLDGAELMAEVWGTQGLNLCPAESWEALDPDAIKAEYEALEIKMNGPRFMLMDWAEVEHPPDAEPRMYGDLEMDLIAILRLDLTNLDQSPYTENEVERTTTFWFWAGSEIYELAAPDGSRYVMQAYSQIVDEDLQEDELSDLGSRLELPQGWTYTSRVLDEELELTIEDLAVVVQDELENTYQRAIDGGQ